MEQTGLKTSAYYCRVSTKEQVMNTSLEMQEKGCINKSTGLNAKVLASFRDEGESAKTADRPNFIKAIEFCKKNHVDYFIVYKLDRFARNQEDHVTVRTILKKCGTQLVSVTEPIDETPIGRAMEGVLSVFAEFDNNVRTERTRGGMMERIKQGIWVWQAPIGFYRPYKGSNIKSEPHNAPYIRLIFEEYVKGIHSYDSLAKFIAERGFRTRNGKIPCAQLIEKIIRNPLYCGIIDVWGIRIKSNFEIVSEELFNRCQQGYKERERSGKRAVGNPDFPLRRSICLTCLGSITGSYSRGRNGKRYPYYHHHKQNCVNTLSIPKATFEQLFVEYLNEINPTVKYENLFKSVMIDIWQSNYKKFDEDNVRTRRDIDGLEQERQKVFDLHRTGVYNDNDFLEQKNVINQKIMEKSQLLHDSRIEEFNMEEALDYCFQFVRNTAETWLRLKKYENRIRFQNNIFAEKISFDGKKFGNTKLSRIYDLNREYNGKKSHLVTPSGFEPEFSR